MSYLISFSYEDEADLIRQLEDKRDHLLAGSMVAYDQVRARYDLKPPAFCMRLRRFLRRGGSFPHTLGRKGKRIVTMAVTPALHNHLTK